MDRHQPDTVISHIMKIIETADHAGQVADTVSVRILKRTDENLIPVIAGILIRIIPINRANRNQKQ